MSLLDRGIGALGHGVSSIGRTYDYITPGSGTSSLTNVGRTLYSGGANGGGGAAQGDPAATASTANSLGVGTNGGTAANTAASPYAGDSGSAGSAADIAAYQDQISSLNQLLGQADITQNNGVNSINQGYGNSLAQLQGNNTNVMNQYDTQKTNTTNDYSKAIGQINSNARSGYNSLQALLGGSGSAADVLAPFAVSQQANSQRGSSADAYAKNLQAVQQGIDAANLNFTNQKKTLDGQKNDQLSKLLSSIDQQKIQYQQQLGAANNQLNVAKGGSYATPTANNNAITQLLQQQQGLASQYAQPTFTTQDYVAPTTDLAQYQAQAAQLAGSNNDPSTSASDDTASALAQLLKQQKTPATSDYSY